MLTAPVIFIYSGVRGTWGYFQGYWNGIVDRLLEPYFMAWVHLKDWYDGRD